MPNARKVTPGQTLDGFPPKMFNGLADILNARASQKPGAAAAAPGFPFLLPTGSLG